MYTIEYIDYLPDDPCSVGAFPHIPLSRGGVDTQKLTYLGT